MPVTPRLRRLLAAALPAVLAVVFTACNADYPNSTFTRYTEFNREVGYLFDILLWLGGIVFVFVEAILLYTIFRFRRRSENDRPEHVHGNTTLEILWTAIPALILAFIAVPTVRTIFKTQAKASASALQVQVIGHQWWWEFKYPQYGITTANELYLPVGRTVNFSLKTIDVLHSFWVPQLGGKRDLITNRENFLWYTPDSVGQRAFNGFCAEYCGTSHANMRFKTFTVSNADFESWAKNQAGSAAFGAVAQAAAITSSAPPSSPEADSGGRSGHTAAPTAGQVAVAAGSPAAPMAGHDMAAMAGGTPVQQAGFIAYPSNKLPGHVVPKTVFPEGLTFNASLVGSAERGRDLISKGGGGCIGCHTIKGNPMMAGVMGPNLTHVGSRTTIAAGLYPNDAAHLSRWIKNARWMKPGINMPTLGAGQWDPVLKQYMGKNGLSDQQIADLVAYLQALK